MRTFINNTIERLFTNALKERTLALLIIRALCFCSSFFKGAWLFRKGELNNSKTAFQSSFFSNSISQRCITRADEASQFLLADLPGRKYQTTETFNNNVLQVFHSCGSFHQNGYAMRSLAILKALDNSNIHLKLITRLGYPWDLLAQRGKPVTSSSIYDGFTFEHLYDPLHLIGDTEQQYLKHYRQWLYQNAREHNASVLHAHSSYINGICAAQVAKQLNVKSVYELRGLWHLSRAVKEPAFKNSQHYQYIEKMEILAARSADKVVTLNRSLKHWLIDNGIEAKSITVVPNGVSFNNNDTIPDPVTSSNPVFTFLFIGSITDYEGLDDVIKAARLIKCDRPFVINIYGTGYAETQLKNLASKLQVTDIVKFKGWVPKAEVDQVYKQSDAILVCRKKVRVCELVTPLKLIEAAGNQKVCIVSKLGALEEVFTNTQDPIYVEPNSPQSIAQGMQLAMAEYASESEKAFVYSQHIREKYNWANAAKTYLEIYKND